MTDFSTIRLRLSKLVPRLSSDADGEIVATVRAIDRTLRAAGFDWHDFASILSPDLPRPEDADCCSETQSWGEAADWCQFNGVGHLSPKEAKFVGDMRRLCALGGEPTAKQAAWLSTISARLRAAGL